MTHDHLYPAEGIDFTAVSQACFPRGSRDPPGSSGTLAVRRHTG